MRTTRYVHHDPGVQHTSGGWGTIISSHFQVMCYMLTVPPLLTKGPGCLPECEEEGRDRDHPQVGCVLMSETTPQREGLKAQWPLSHSIVLLPPCLLKQGLETSWSSPGRGREALIPLLQACHENWVLAQLLPTFLSRAGPKDMLWAEQCALYWCCVSTAHGCDPTHPPGAMGI
jgi:hypothetical protein